ncbi:MAG TPA: hypothetical protein VD969_07665 [Symbiobacteriaceae bacterium]|nr:hypothetical protein [Symbiobacteriaceae bacterium]
MEIYLFGAGASAAEGAPATHDFLARAWTLLGPAFDERIRAVWRFVETVFRVPVTGPAAFDFLPAVDEVISLVDWSLQNNEGLGHLYDLPRLYQVRRDLEHLLCTTLAAALADRPPGAAPGPHHRFARRLAQRSGRYALISLNYDTLLDGALAEAGLAPDYGLGGAPGGGPLLAKLHGSLNWALCPACSHIELGGGPACVRCENPRLHGLIISPTWLKSYRGAHLQQVWDQALACLRQAERIVFVGYSMPPADIPIYHLLQRGLLAGPVGHRRPAIHVINHAGHEEAVMARFARLFGPDITFDFNGFYGQV